MAESSYRRTKIVCTLGPSTDRPGMLEKLIGAGLDVARLNAAHGDSDQHRRRVRHLRQIAARLGKSVALLMDLPGPKYRLGKLRASSQTLQQGHDVSLGSSAAGEDVLPLADLRLLKDLRVGDPVFLADGTVQLAVSRILPGRARCRVEIGGVVRSGSGLNLPTSRLSVRLPTEEDLPWIDFAVTEKIEWLGISFVRGAEDVENVRRHLGREEDRPHLIAKIEKREALSHLEAVVHAADGVMVARGDLGVETPLESVPMAQKRIIAEANLQGKPVITATQMLESMVEHSSPTRAEVTDVANAILDGTDAVMLSAETAIGAHGVEAVRTLDAVSRATEAQFPYGALLKKFSQIPWASMADAISLAVTRLSFDLKAAAIGVACDAEASAFRIARFRPKTPIIVFCYRPADRGRFQLICNARPALVKPEDAFKPAALRKVLADLKVAAGPDKVVLLVGADRQAAMESDFIQIVRLR